MHRATRAAVLAIVLNVNAAHATDHIYVPVAPNTTVGAGFGELSPGTHTLELTLTTSSGMFHFASAYDQYGMSTWQPISSGGGSSYTLRSTNAQEDTMDWIAVSGAIYNTSPPYMPSGFNVKISNVTWAL